MIRLGSRVDVRVPAKDFAPVSLLQKRKRKAIPRVSLLKQDQTILYRGI